MPTFPLFKKADHLYSVLAHKAVRYSGHDSRCNRQLANRFGSESYRGTELGSAFLSPELELETEPRLDHAPYVQDWLKLLERDQCRAKS